MGEGGVQIDRQTDILGLEIGTDDGECVQNANIKEDGHLMSNWRARLEN